MKILFLPSWYPSKYNPVKGIFIKEHAKAVSLFNDVVVLYLEYDGNIKTLWKTLSDRKEDGIRTIRVKYRKLLIPKEITYSLITIKLFRKILNSGWKPDIIHAHIFLAGLPAVLLGKIYNLPVIVSEHWSVFTRSKLSKSKISMARFVFNRAKIILPVSKNLEKAIKSCGIRNRFEVIPNVVNTDIFYQEPKNYKSKIKNILFVGSLSETKGLSYLLHAINVLAKKRKDFILDIIGDSRDRKRYEDLSRNLKIDEMVRFHGLKSKDDVAKFMKQCDFYVQPSVVETFGITFIEAMACGKPVIGTKIPVLEEKINQERGILVQPGNVQDLVNAIDYMLDHHQNYSSEKISLYVKENFTYEVIGKKIDNVYRDILCAKK